VMIFSYRNNLLAYTNELVWGPSNKINLVGPVNLEYDQYRKAGFSGYLYERDSSIPVGDTIHVQLGNLYYIPDTLNNKHRVFKNYSILELNKENTVRAVKRTNQIK
jgi:hypothetical protein